MHSLEKHRKFFPSLILLAAFLLLTQPVPVSAGINQWTEITGTDDTALLAVSPNFPNDQTIFAGTRTNGVLKSVDGGQNWSPASGGISDKFVTEIVVSPNYQIDKTVFAGTLLDGIFRTTDGGDTWTPVNTGLNENYILSLAISPDFVFDNTLFAGTTTDVFRSVDGGNNWTEVTGIIGGSPLSMAVSPDYGNDHTVFVGTGIYNGIYKSTNDGDDWSNMSADLLVIQDVEISPDYANDQTVFAGTEFGVYKSTNGGFEWTEANNGLGVEDKGFPKYIMDLEISPDFANDHTIFAANYGVFKSNNGGASWTPLNSGFPASNFAVQALALPPDYASGRTVFSTIYSIEEGYKAYRYTFSPLTSSLVWDSGPGNWEWSAGKLAPGDFNGDGFEDLAVLYGYALERQAIAWVFTGNGFGFNPPQSWWNSGPGNWDWEGGMLESGDFNGDGLDDLAVLYGYAVERDVKTFVFPSNGNQFAGSEKWWHAGTGNWDFGENLLSSGDFNGDGIDDLLVMYRYYNFPYSVNGENVTAFVFPSTGSQFPVTEEWWKSYTSYIIPWNDHTEILTGGFDNFASPGDDFAILTDSPGEPSWLFGLPSQILVYIDPIIDPTPLPLLPASAGFVFTTPEQTWWAAAPEDWSWMSAKAISGDFDGNGLDEFAVLYDYGGSRSGLIVIR